MTVTINYKGQIATEAGTESEDLHLNEPLPLIEILQALSEKAADAVDDFIFDEERMLQEQPEYALLLSWHYSEPIIKKLRQKGLRSKIILPLPDVKIIEP